MLRSVVRVPALIAREQGVLLAVLLVAFLAMGMSMGADVATANDTGPAEVRNEISTVSEAVEGDLETEGMLATVIVALAEASEDATLAGFDYGHENPGTARGASPALAIASVAGLGSYTHRRLRRAWRGR